MRRTVTLIAAWVTATVLAVSLAFAGVRLVADNVVDAPVVLSTPDATPGDDPTPDDGPTPGDDPTPDDGPTPDDDPTPEVTATSAPASPSPSPSPSASATPSPSSSQAQPVTRTYTLIGGTVTFRFSSSEVEVIAATPADGFNLHSIEPEGPLEMKVEFRAHDDSHRSRIDGWWANGPRHEIREERRS